MVQSGSYLFGSEDRKAPNGINWLDCSFEDHIKISGYFGSEKLHGVGRVRLGKRHSSEFLFQ